MNTQLKFNFSDGYLLGTGLADTEHSWGTKESSKGGERRRSWNDISHIRSVWRETDKPDQSIHSPNHSLVAHATRVHSETVSNAPSQRFDKAHSHDSDVRHLKRTW